MQRATRKMRRQWRWHHDIVFLNEDVTTAGSTKTMIRCNLFWHFEKKTLKHLIRPAHAKTVLSNCHLLEYMPSLVYDPSISPSPWHAICLEKFLRVQVHLGCIKAAFVTHEGLGSREFVKTMEGVYHCKA